MAEKRSTYLLVAGEEMNPLEFTVTPELKSSTCTAWGCHCKDWESQSVSNEGRWYCVRRTPR